MHLPLLTPLLLLASLPSPTTATLSWTLAKSSSPTADQSDAYARIETAMRLAVARWTRLSPSTSKTIRVAYAPGVPTAEANFNGDLRFGSNRAYVNERTALHEISHTLGIGQTAAFNTRCSAGDWPRGNALVAG